MLIRAPAIVCSVRPNGEHGAIVRVMTADHGLAAAYVAGARGRELRPVLIPGNLVAIEVHARASSQLPSARVELVASRGPWLSEPLPSAGITWACVLTASVLPEGHAYPLLHDSLAALLDAICHAPSARGWARVLAGYEVLLLREVGYGAAPVPPPEEDWDSLLARLDRQGKAIANRLLADRAGDVMGARAILIERLRRIGGG
ncbi:MAG: DNA recombination protein RecO [Novosphingobium sp. 17-62-19]|uniref:DNA repair protein RecO n=1 Tax=Novosphingobium sp. 17-62-19 TaxID=1970406 RepID=UPI000BCB9FBA|nr:recombination protein O N-terminal domain-containing protein [Novosphingobium sp. 17-62-19]OZA20396.1 MAG: DNA recombination protein RecO [Novosphingobium sp. 17-62-19]OZA72458.1 MAG: DNA recombination protein RecO [Sphingomonadales bacterium 39-62-4]HQS96387.1 recombination protein O N-terminal domain-containing protein [Novosphingobium sp.]